MSLTSRQKRPLERVIPHKRDTRLVVIATEGSSTEKDYFNIFRKKNSRVQVKVLPTVNGMSAPRHVLHRLKKFRDEFELGTQDALFLVIDKDRWPDAQLAKVASDARKSKFVLAVSCPCFEVWLYLHFDDPTPEMKTISSREMEQALHSLLNGYNKTNLRTELFEPYVVNAVKRAKKIDILPSDRWPNQIGTRVYLVIEKIGVPSS